MTQAQHTALSTQHAGAIPSQRLRDALDRVARQGTIFTGRQLADQQAERGMTGLIADLAEYVEHLERRLASLEKDGGR